jgi:hypothetical protein
MVGRGATPADGDGDGDSDDEADQGKGQEDHIHRGQLGQPRDRCGGGEEQDGSDPQAMPDGLATSGTDGADP